MARKSVLELLMDDHQSAYAPQAGLGYGVQPDDLGAMGVLPRSARQAPPAIPQDEVPPAPRAPDITVSGAPGAPLPREAPPAIPQGAPDVAPAAPAAPEMGAPRMFRSSAGPGGAYNMGELPPGTVATNRQGVPLGQTMVPVVGLSRGQASVGVPDVPGGAQRSQVNLAPEISGPAGSIDNLDRVAQESPMVRSLVNSGVIRATEAEKNTLGRMRAGMLDQGSANTRDQGRQQQEVDFARARVAGDDQARRQIAVAQGTPQVVASGAGVGGWDPQQQAPFSEVRAPNVFPNNGKGMADHQKIIDPQTGMSAAQLLAEFSKTRPRSANDPTSRFMLASAIQAAQGDQEKIRQAQEMWGKDSPGDPAMNAYFGNRLKYVGIDPLAESGLPSLGPAGQPAAPAAAPVAPAAPAPAPAAAAAKQQSFRDKYARK